MTNNEMERILALSDLDLDYTNFNNNFSDLARLAAKIAGTEISLVSIIDTYTQWVISNYGMDSGPVNREDTICQYTIAEEHYFEIPDLSLDARFADKDFVTSTLNLRYYFGLPINVQGQNIGSLCVIDNKPKKLSPEKIELLKIIATEIVNRLKALKLIEALKYKVEETTSTQNKVIHDIRGPLSGIVGLAEYMSTQGQSNKINDVLDMISLIHKSGNSILELADEILSSEVKKMTNEGLTLSSFKEKLYQLYTPQAKNKNIHLEINNLTTTEVKLPAKSKLLQIAGNLISNAIKFTPSNGGIKVQLSVEMRNDTSFLNIVVTDNGIGIDEQTIKLILSSKHSSGSGTEGEKGFGFGLQLVLHLIQSLEGTLNISKGRSGSGTEFKVELPIT
ncbi:MAG: GAF domain-containing sensor histidine kinase [Bacteroidota bacterium]